MTKRRWSLAALTLACLLFAACGTPPVGGPQPLTGEAEAKPASSLSCAERSAQTKPPKHPLVELAWCIAQTDDLYDPDHLFHETLGIKNDRTYRESRNVPWGISVGAGGRLNMDEIRHLPVGIVEFRYMRVDDETRTVVGKRYLGFGINPKTSCVRLENVFATFGRDFLLAPPPIVAPASPSSATGSTPPSAALNVPGVFYMSPRFFTSDGNGLIHFGFIYDECASHVSVQRNVDPTTYRQIERQE